MVYSRTLWFIHSLYNSLHLLTPNSQSIPPPPPPPPWQPEVCSLCPQTVLHPNSRMIYSKHKITTLLKTPHRLLVKLKIKSKPLRVATSRRGLLPRILPLICSSPASLFLKLLIFLPAMFFSQRPPSHFLHVSWNPRPQKRLLWAAPVILYYKHLLFKGLSLSEMMYSFIFYLFSDPPTLECRLREGRDFVFFHAEPPVPGT